MDRKYYVTLNIALLVAIGITFYFQVKSFGKPGIMQWLPLVVLGVVALCSFILQRQMKKEDWFINQQKSSSQDTKDGAA